LKISGRKRLREDFFEHGKEVMEGADGIKRWIRRVAEQSAGNG
jgi:hypothetical protein